jgi:hypothetical protein
VARPRILERRPRPTVDEALFGRREATAPADEFFALSEERLAGYAHLLELDRQQRVAQLESRLRTEVEAELADARRREVEAALRARHE